MTIEPGIERRHVEKKDKSDTVYFTGNIGNPDYDTRVYSTVEFNLHISHGILDLSQL